MSQHLSDERRARLSSCTNAQEVMSLLVGDGVELSDDQLKGVVGGTSDGTSLEQLFESLGYNPGELFPEGFRFASTWSNVPIGN